MAFAAIKEENTELRAALSAITAAPVPPRAPASPWFRGYARLGTGQYLMNHSAPGVEAEFIISVATDAEKAGRVVGDERANPDSALLQPDAMAVRIAFANVAGLDALEGQLRKLRAEHFPSSHAAIPAGWVPLTVTWDEGYPEQVAFGPQRMMDRLKKWLDKFYELRLAVPDVRCDECAGTGKCGPDENPTEMDCEVCLGEGVTNRCEFTGQQGLLVQAAAMLRYSMPPSADSEEARCLSDRIVAALDARWARLKGTVAPEA